MSRRKKVTTIEELDPELETATPVELENSEGGDPLEDALVELAGSASSFTIFKLPAIGQSGKRKFCCSYRADELGEQGIEAFAAERWGGGRYMVAARGVGGVIFKNQTFEIDPSVKPKTEIAEAPRVDTSKSEMIELVREVLRERGAGGGSNAAETTAAIIASAGQQAAAMIGMIQPLIAQMAENTKPQAPPWEMIVPILTTALELGADARSGGAGDGPGAYLPIVEKFASILDRAMTKGAMPPAKQLPPKGTENKPVASNPNEPGWVKGLRPYLPYVLEQAAAGVPPEFFLGELEQKAPRIVDWLSNQDPETWPAELGTHAPELQPHLAWVKQLLEAIGDGEEEGRDDEPGTEGGGVN